MSKTTSPQIRPLQARYSSQPPSSDLLWLEIKHFAPKDRETVLLAWPRSEGFTFRTGVLVNQKWKLSNGTEPREKPTFFAELKA